MKKIDYNKNLKRKYCNFGVSMINPYSKDFPFEKENNSEEWDEFFKAWNDWGRKEKQEFLLYLSEIENHKVDRWIMVTVLIIGFCLGLIF